MSVGNLNLPLSLISKQSHPDVWPSGGCHVEDGVSAPLTHGKTLSGLICLSDSAVSATGCWREGIYYWIDLAVQLGGNWNFSFHFSLGNVRLSGALKKGSSDIL